MSNVYVLEPATKGKVVMHTTLGPLDIELWPKEAPKACRNFVQLCLEGYYNNTIFHRVVRNFIAQGGDPTGTGAGGESIYGGTFPDEFHSRLRFTHRGLLCCASFERNKNGSQFFFTLDRTPELERKHTIFGKVVGDTIYNLAKFNDLELDGEKPKYPPKVLSTEVVWNPFDDIIPRVFDRPRPLTEADASAKPKPVSHTKAIKSFALLSFGDEAEESEKFEIEAKQKEKKRMVSADEVLEEELRKSGKLKTKDTTEDTKSSENAENGSKSSTKQAEGSLSKDDIKRKEKEDAERRTADMKERINKIAAAAAAKEKKADKDEDEDEDDESSSSDDEKVMDLKAARAEEIERMSFAEKMRLSVMERERERKEKEAKKKAEEELLKKQQEIKKLTAGIDKQSYLAMKNAKYGTKMSKEDREKMVLQKLASFTSALRKASANSSGESKDEDQDDKSWMTHTLVFEKPKETSAPADDGLVVYDSRLEKNKGEIDERDRKRKRESRDKYSDRRRKRDYDDEYSDDERHRSKRSRTYSDR